MNFKGIPIVRAEDLIPKGTHYCYTSNGIFNNGRMKIKPCPFWGCDDSKPEQISGTCSYLHINDWDSEYMSLLWDQVKECGIGYPEE